MDNVLAIITRAAERVNRLMHGGHEFIVGAKRDFGDQSSAFFQLINVNTGRIDGTKDRKLGGVSNLSLAPSILAKDTLAAQNPPERTLLRKSVEGDSPAPTGVLSDGCGACA
jgi:hypothetical protein